jgi:hypothetical protein
MFSSVLGTKVTPAKPEIAGIVTIADLGGRNGLGSYWSLKEL